MLRYMSLGGDAPRRRTGSAFNPSTLAGCVRRAVYKAAGCPEDREHRVPDETQDIFDRGTVLGAWVAAIYRAADGHGGVSDVECQAIDRDERLVVDNNLGLGGFIDVSFKWHGQRRLVEVKSKGFDGLAKLTSADATQQKQLNDYLSIDGVEHGSMLYVAPGPDATLQHKEFLVTQRADLWEQSQKEVRTRAMMLRAPDKLGPPSSNPRFECSSCPFRRSCERGLTPAQLLQR